MCLRVIAELTRQTLICDINAVECLRTLIISGRNTLQSLNLFSLFAATVCYLEKWQKLTRDDLEARRWLRSPHCSELSRTSDAWGTTISPSLPFSVHLSGSQDGQSFPLLKTANAQGGPQGNNASMSLQRTSTRKVFGTRAAQGTWCT